jgi:hypothetical protein
VSVAVIFGLGGFVRVGGNFDVGGICWVRKLCVCRTWWICCGCRGLFGYIHSWAFMGEEKLIC